MIFFGLLLSVSLIKEYKDSDGNLCFEHGTGVIVHVSPCLHGHGLYFGCVGLFICLYVLLYVISWHVMLCYFLNARSHIIGIFPEQMSRIQSTM